MHNNILPKLQIQKPRNNRRKSLPRPRSQSNPRRNTNRLHIQWWVSSKNPTDASQRFNLKICKRSNDKRKIIVIRWNNDKYRFRQIGSSFTNSLKRKNITHKKSGIIIVKWSGILRPTGLTGLHLIFGCQRRRQRFDSPNIKGSHCQSYSLGNRSFYDHWSCCWHHSLSTSQPITQTSFPVLNGKTSSRNHRTELTHKKRYSQLSPLLSSVTNGKNSCVHACTYLAISRL